MNRCLCCGKPLKEDSACGWHKACVKRFFGVNEIPTIEVNRETLEKIAKENVKRGLTIPGVQKKISLHLSVEHHASRLTLVDYPTGYILKPEGEEFPCLPEAEQLVMSMAEATGIAVVPHALFNSGSSYAYITRRIDRIIKKDAVSKLAMEDFCQLSLRMTEDKYKSSYERCAKVIEKYSSQSGLDMAEFFFRVLFSFVSGNSDMHLKNFSLIETEAGSGVYVLSSAYDLLPVSLLMPTDTEELALPLSGKKTHIRRKDFLIFAEECHLPNASAEKMIKKIVSMETKYIEMINDSLLTDALKKDYIALIRTRIGTLKS